MATSIDDALGTHLLRGDGQEDVCLASYVQSAGATRVTSILTNVILPRPGERKVHGNAAFTSEYVVRAAAEASARGEGLAILHSHPSAQGWQGLSIPDHQTEGDYARVAQAFTRKPLLGMTLAGADHVWSARQWFDASRPHAVESVRVVVSGFAFPGMSSDDPHQESPAHKFGRYQRGATRSSRTSLDSTSS